MFRSARERVFKRLVLSGSGLALAAMLPLGHVALADKGASAPGQPPAAGMTQTQPAPTTEVSKADLKKFAKASQALHKLQAEHQQALSGVQDQTKATERPRSIANWFSITAPKG